MRYIFAGTNRKIFEALKTCVCREGDSFSFYESGLDLLKKLVLNDTCADLILLEYSVYKGFADFFYNILSSRNLKIPLILLGEAGLKKDEMINNWISENELQYDLQNLHNLVPVFKQISSFLEKSEIKPLLEKSFEKPSENKESDCLMLSGKAKLNPVDSLRRKTDLSPVVYNLLSYLYKNRCREVSLKEIESQLKLNAEDEKARKNTVYAYISRLRKCIENTPLCTMEVLRTRTGYYKLFLR